MKQTLVVGLVTATLAAGLIVYGTQRLAGQGQGSSPEQTLLAQVKGHPLAKLGPWLVNLYEEYQQFASAGGRSRAAFKSRNPAIKVRDGFVAIEGAANDAVALTRTLTAIGA